MVQLIKKAGVWCSPKEYIPFAAVLVLKVDYTFKLLNKLFNWKLSRFPTNVNAFFVDVSSGVIKIEDLRTISWNKVFFPNKIYHEMYYLKFCLVRFLFFTITQATHEWLMPAFWAEISINQDQILISSGNGAWGILCKTTMWVEGEKAKSRTFSRGRSWRAGPRGWWHHWDGACRCQIR